MAPASACTSCPATSGTTTACITSPTRWKSLGADAADAAAASATGAPHEAQNRAPAWSGWPHF
jgi:hypothetical protein